jgi:Zn-dependent peptidase ImmA (M78 family)
VTGHYKSPQQILDRLGITEPGEIDLTAIAYDCGAIVLEGELHGCEARLVGARNEAFITVNRQSYGPRKRFSIGHEIGHWMHDRGVASFTCGKVEFQSWDAASPETRANNYAADLLLPKSMFVPRAVNRPITLATTSELANTFQTSLTSTAIRLVECGGKPSVVVYTTAQGIRWSRRNRDVPFPVKVRDSVDSDSVAYDILRGKGAPGPTDVAASSWFIDYHAARHSVREDSQKVWDGVLTLLWWPDESHLLQYV